MAEGFQEKMKAILAKKDAEEQQKVAAEQKRLSVEQKEREEAPFKAKECFKALTQQVTSETEQFTQIVPARFFVGVFELAIGNKYLLASSVIDRELTISIYNLPFTSQVERIGEGAISVVYYDLFWQGEVWLWKLNKKMPSLRNLGARNMLRPSTFKQQDTEVLTLEQMHTYYLDLILMLVEMP